MRPIAATTRHGTLNAPTPTVIIVNSDEATRRWLEATIVAAGLDALGCSTASELRARLLPGTAACVILDVALADANGLELQGDLACSGVAVLFVTRERCIASCVRAVKSGAVDYLTLPCDANRLVRALQGAMRQAHFAWAERVQSSALCGRYELLTTREREIFVLVASGLLNKQIAQQLGISEITVQIHRGRVMRKMSARSFASLVRMADALQTSRSQTSESIGHAFM